MTALALTLSQSQSLSSVSVQTHPAPPATLQSRLLDEEADSGVRQMRGLLPENKVSGAIAEVALPLLPRP